MLASWFKGPIVVFLAVIMLTVFVKIGGAYEIEDKIKELIQSVIPLHEQDTSIENLSVQEKSAYIEKEVYEEVEKNGSATVIIYLSNEEIDYSDVKLIKKQIRERQDKVLKALLNEDTEENNENYSQDEFDILLINNNFDGNENKTIRSEVVSDGELADEDADAEEVNETVENFVLIYRYEVVNGFAGVVGKKGMEILEKSDLVKGVYLERVLHTSMNESLKLINVDDVWRVHTQYNGTTGPNITGVGQIACVVDTGVDYTHPDLGGCLGNNCKVLAGYNFINNTNNPMDVIGHGTHVAGIVAANGAVQGVAPDAKLLAARVCINSDNCPGSAMIAGVDWCVNQHLFNYDVDVITMSLGDGGEYTNANCPSWMNNALSITSLYGIPVTVSSGNNAFSNGISYPACNANVISVGAVYDANVGAQPWNSCTDLTTFADKVACFSNTGNNLDLMAPGAMITSTWLNNGVLTIGGTSMAAPHVAGTIALIKQVKSQINPGQIEDLLKNSGKKVIDASNGLNFTRIDAVDVINKLVGPRWGDEIRLTFSNTAHTGSSLLEIDSQGNSHVMWLDDRVGGISLYYKKLNSDGNVLINDTRIINNVFMVFSFDLAIDSQDNVHFVSVLNSVPLSAHNVYYKKLDNNGNALINATLLTFYPGSPVPSTPRIAIDSQDNVHAVWWRIASQNYTFQYKKLNNYGNVLVNEKTIVFSNNLITHLPILKIDSQNNLHFLWTSKVGPYSQGYNFSDSNFDVYYKKLDSDGNVLVNDTQLTFDPRASIGLSADLDESGNIDVLWNDVRNNSLGCNYDCNWSLYHKKINNVGLTIINEHRLMTKIGYQAIYLMYNYNLMHTFHAANATNVIYSNFDFGSNKSYYSRIDTDANLLIEPIKLSNSSSDSVSSSLKLDEEHNSYIVWSDLRHAPPGCSTFTPIICQSTVYFRRTYPQIDITMHGTPAPGNVINLELQDEMSRNKSYFAGFSGGMLQGITLPDGRNIPLNFDALLSQSVYNPSSIGVANSFGNLDGSGRANVTLTLPNVSLAGISIYGGFVTANPSTLQLAGISDATKITFV